MIEATLRNNELSRREAYGIECASEVRPESRYDGIWW